MSQEPRYLMIGDGRVAKHLGCYFSFLNLSFETWTRKQPQALLQEKAGRASHILLPIKDGAIEDVAVSLRAFAPQAMIVHFSGALATEAAIGAHPLMTFGSALYTFEKYRAIPFVLDADAPPFEKVLPGLPNAHARLAKDKKAYYHALCVLAGNFSCLLWQRFFEGLEKDLQIGPDTGKPYLRQQTENLLSDYAQALTGPLTRGDNATLEKNIRALDGDPFADVYRAFVTAFRKTKTVLKNELV